MTPWWLALGLPGLLWHNPLFRLKRVLEFESALEHSDQQQGHATQAAEHWYGRFAAFEAFLTDPGYCDVLDIRQARELAPDIFGERQMQQYLGTIWPRHLLLLKYETALHAFAIMTTATALLLAPHLPALGVLVVLLAWLLAVYAELLWPPVAGLVREMLFHRGGLRNRPEVERRLLQALPWWQRPAARLLYVVARLWKPHDIEVSDLVDRLLTYRGTSSPAGH